MKQFIIKLLAILTIATGYCWIAFPLTYNAGPVAVNLAMAGWVVVCVPIIYFVWRIEVRR